MNVNINPEGNTGKSHRQAGTAGGFRALINKWVHKLFSKSIYTRVLFTNVTAFAAGLAALVVFSSFGVKQIAYNQVKQELLHKAKRVNFALVQQTHGIWEGLPVEESPDQARNRQELLNFLADTFDISITIFNKEGNITGASKEQEVLPGSRVEKEYIEILGQGETVITHRVDRETGLLTFAAVVPMGNHDNPVENGILLETRPSNLNLVLNNMSLLMLIGGMAILLIFIFISVYLAMCISRPISRLAAAVTEISRGRDYMGIEDQPLDEINLLAGQLKKLALMQQRIQAESSRMEEERTRLFSEISHELRTPLTSIQGFVEAIRDGMVQDEALLKRYLDTIYSQTLHITRLVDDMLALSRLESNNIRVEKLPVDMVAIAQGAVMSMEAEAADSNTTIVLEKKAHRAMVIGDVDRMGQILRNLLKNAIKATENGTVRVIVETGQDQVILTIKDSGMGIAPEDLPHIWDRFYRAKGRHGSQTKEKGSGLGLVIVKKLVEMQGGSINVASRLGEGTVFTIRFPVYQN